jgi:xanthine dehydrogenase YagS FAD-binding subunit
MKEITHINASTIAEAVSALGANAAVIAGGTDILGQLKSMISPNAPDTLVNIKTISGLDEIKEEGGVLKIGALAKLTDIAESSVVKGNYAALAEAANKVASPELRKKNPSGICNALVGDNRYHSIYGTLEGCVAVNPSDTAPALVALDAKIVTTKNSTGYDAEDFFAVNGEKTTVLDDDEIVTEIQVPTPAAGTKSAFVKNAIRKSFDFPIVNCAAAISSSSARICLNAVYNNPHRATEAEDSISGQTINDASAEAAGAAAVASATALPGDKNKYMIQIAKTLVKRAILACA